MGALDKALSASGGKGRKGGSSLDRALAGAGRSSALAKLFGDSEASDTEDEAAASIASQSSALDNVLASIGESDASEATKAKAEAQAHKKGSPLQGLFKVLEVLDLPRAAVVSTIHEGIDQLNGGDNSHGLMSGIKRHEGVGDSVNTGNKWLDRIIGFTGDVALDPLTYLAPEAKLAQAGTKGLARQLIREGADEAAAKVLAKGARELTTEELGKVGAKGGLYLNVPGTGKVARALGLATEPSQIQLLPHDIARKLTGPLEPLRALHANVSDRLGLEKPLKQMMRSGDPVAAKAGLQALDARRLRFAEAKALERTWVGNLRDPLKKINDAGKGRVLVRALEGDAEAVANLSAAGLGDAHTAVAGWLRDIRAEANSKAGEKFIKELHDYFPHFRTSESLDAAAGKRGGKAFGKSTVEMKRKLAQGEEFLGEELKDHSIAEIDRIGQTVLGQDYVALFEQNPVKVLPAYARLVAKRTGEKMLERDLADLGIGGDRMVSKVVEEINPALAPAEKALGAELRGFGQEQGRLDKVLAKLDTKAEPAAPGAQLAENFARDEAKLVSEQKALFGEGTTFDGPRTPVPAAQEGAARYMREKGLGVHLEPRPDVKVNDKFMTRLAKAYEALPESVDPATAEGKRTIRAYDALRKEVAEQYDHLTKAESEGGMGIKVIFTEDDPYADAAEMMADVVNNKTLKVFGGGTAPHDLLPQEDNLKFRAVHDFFGHLMSGNRFDRHGEEIAWLNHSQMFSDTARPAMTTETRGQNSWLNYAAENVAKKARGEAPDFPVQKAALLPEEFTRKGTAYVPAGSASPERVAQIKREVAPLDAELKKLGKQDAAVRKMISELGEREAESAELTIEGIGKVRMVEAPAAIRQKAQALVEQRAAITENVAPPEIVREMDARRVRAEKVQKLADERAALAEQYNHAAAIVGDDPGLFQSKVSTAKARLVEIDAKIAARGDKSPSQLLEARGAWDRALKALERSQRSQEKWARDVHKLEAQAAETEARLAERGTRVLAAHEGLAQLSQTVNVERTVDMLKEGLGAQGWKEYAQGKIAVGELADFLGKTSKVTTPEGMRGFLSFYDKALSLWKAYAILTPGFHFRNSFGGFMNMYVDDVELRNVRRFFKAVRGKGPAEDRALVEQLRSQGIMTGGQASHEVETELLGKGRFNPGSQNNVAVQFSRGLGENVENFLRGAHAFDVLKKAERRGVAAETAMADAIDRVYKFHFNYDDLNDFEKTTARRVVPFWTWTSRNLPLQLEQMVRNPRAFKRYLDVKRNVELGLEDEDIVPSYFGEIGGMQTPFKIGGSRVYATPDLPFIQGVAKPIDPGQLLSSVSPLLKTPAELWAGKQFFSDIPFKKGLYPAPKTWAPIMPVLGMLGRAQKGRDGGWLMSDKDSYTVEQFLPLLGRTRRLVPNEKRYQSRVVTTWASFLFGAGLRSNTPQAQWGELRRRTDNASALLRGLQDTGYAEKESR